MVKNSVISIISQKENEENRGSVEFQVFSFTTKIRRLTSHLELHKKDFSSQRGLRLCPTAFQKTVPQDT